MFEFFNKVHENLETVQKNEKENIETLVEMLHGAVKNKNTIYIFGAGHAGIISQEMYYRAGGFMLFNPIFPRELSLDNEPITITSKMERLNGYGEIIASKADFKQDDILIVHSVSGRNSAGIEMALFAKEKGVKVVSVTNVAYSKSVTSRHNSGKRLFEVSDLVIDNHGYIGDAACEIGESGQRVGPTSTIVASAILNEVIVQLATRLDEEGITQLPFFYSANIDGGDEKNQELFKVYQNQIKYKF